MGRNSQLSDGFPMRAMNSDEEKSGAAARNLHLQFPIHGKAA
jgi:hypothetical protein